MVPLARSAWGSMHGLAMVAALVILAVIVAVGALLNPSGEDFRWFLQLRRPRWLTFIGYQVAPSSESWYGISSLSSLVNSRIMPGLFENPSEHRRRCGFSVRPGNDNRMPTTKEAIVNQSRH